MLPKGEGPRDVGAHLVAARRLEEPRTNGELFQRLGAAHDTR